MFFSLKKKNFPMNRINSLHKLFSLIKEAVSGGVYKEKVFLKILQVKWQDIWSIKSARSISHSEPKARFLLS